MGRIKRLATAVAVCAAAAGMVPAAAMATRDPTTTTLSPSPTPASTNQPVTLTAAVTGKTVMPVGTVSFANNGTVIPGCGYRPLSAAQGDTATATCTVAFAAATSPESLTATYGHTRESRKSKTASPVVLTITKGATSTTLTASGTKPSIDATVTYTALVIPVITGAANPYGNVEFMDGTIPIGSCASQPLSAGAATCITSYPTAGLHQITAYYYGDTDFSASRSGIMTVNAVSPPSPAVPAPSPGGTTLSPVLSRPAVGQTTVKGDSASVRVSCTQGPGCKVTAEVLRITRSRQRVHHRFKTVTHTRVLASFKATIAGGQKREIKLTLDRRGRRLLAYYHRLKLTLAVTDLVGRKTETVSRRPVTFRATERRH